MLKNYFITALRTFRRNKFFSLINIAGLAIGISASLVIYLIVHYEFSYEKFEPNRDRIYRVVTNMHFPNQDFKNGGVPGPLPAAVRKGIPSVEKSAFIIMESKKKVSIGEKTPVPLVFKDQGDIILATDDYFSFLNYKWIAGSPANALGTPGKVVLTESRARTYFPYVDIAQAIGQTITYDDTVNAVVAGIVQDINGTTEFTFNEFISYTTYESRLGQEGYAEWGNVNSAWQYFVQLKKGADPQKVDQQLAEIRKKNAKDAYLATDHFLQPLSDIHFNPDFDSITKPKAHKPTLYGLLAIAGFLLLLGCINFINLTTAQASQRAKEIGIRKTMGSSKIQLIIQFLSETFLVTLAAGALSIALTPWILKIFSGFIPEEVSFEMIKQPEVLLFILALVIVVSLLSGIYPALILAGYKPVLVLKNVAYTGTAKTRRVWIRKSLTISQFVIAQFFIIATMGVGQQIRFSLNKDMGFKKDAIIYFHAPVNSQNPESRQFALQQRLNTIPGIEKISLAGSPPASSGTSSTTMKFNNDGREIETTVEVKSADTSYFDLYHIQFLAGRKLQQSDTANEYVINNTYAEFLGFNDPRKIIGLSIERGDKKIPVVGVIADINTKSVHSAITPLAFNCQASGRSTFHIALAPGNKGADSWKRTISAIEKAYKELYPEQEFNCHFFDEDIANFYKKELDIAKLLNWSTGLSIFISCLGLLGLVIFTTTQRVKEIGVRKVLGASVSQIVTLLSKDFVWLVIIAFVITAPVAWWAINKWLDSYAYRVHISLLTFAFAGFGLLFIALVTVSFQAIKAALANPVKSLRTE